MTINDIRVSVSNTAKSKGTPADSLRFLFELEDIIYNLLGKESIRYNGNELHTKHRHIKYHDFFVNNIYPEERVLDLGCGNGAVDYDILSKVLETTILGVDLSEGNIKQARDRCKDFGSNTYYIVRDFTKNTFWDQIQLSTYDVVILSNVLEHIEERVELLNEIRYRIKPKRLLLRVPMFKRDWRIPLRKELGINYMLDDTHKIEYIQEELEDEIKLAGFKITQLKTNWGEFWCVLETV